MLLNRAFLRSSVSTFRRDPARASFRLKSSNNKYAKHGNLDSMITDLPKTPHHVEFCNMLKDEDVPLVFATGSAGTGKTLMSTSYALYKLINKEVKKVIITRPTVPLEEELGHLPGKLAEKMHPYLVPIYDSFKEYITVQRLNEFIKNEEVEICAIAHIRGRTFHNAWILVDEAQNLTKNQMKTLLTRIGQNSKMIVSGDLEQSDLKEKNGLEDFVERYKLYLQENGVDDPNVHLVEFDETDIMRSEIVKHVINIYKY